MQEEIEKTIKELQNTARKNGFYLCPVILWNKITGVIEYKDSEIKRVKKERDSWRKKYQDKK